MDPWGLSWADGLNFPFGIGMPFPMPMDWSKFVTDLFKKQQEGTKTEEKEECKGRYFRHYTSFENLKSIISSGEIWASENGDFGPGVYFTYPWVPSWFVGPKSAETWIDVWVPDKIRKNPALWRQHRWGIEQRYLGGDYGIYDKGKPPIPGPMRPKR